MSPATQAPLPGAVAAQWVLSDPFAPVRFPNEKWGAMKKLSGAEIQESMADVPGWTRTGELLERNFEFPDFEVAMAFVNKVAWAAEKVAHHPDIDIRWNRVRLGLTTHDAGGLTDLDFGLAAKCNTLATQVLRTRKTAVV